MHTLMFASNKCNHDYDFEKYNHLNHNKDLITQIVTKLFLDNNFNQS